MQIKVNDNEFQLFVGEKRILEHSKERPMIYVGVGQEDVDMYRGNFKITDYVTERFPLKLTDVIQTADTVRLCFESYIIRKLNVTKICVPLISNKRMTGLTDSGSG